MALQRTEPVSDGSFLKLTDLAADKPVLVVFKIREFLPPEPNDYGYSNVPVLADAFVASGPRQGEVWFSQKFFGAVTKDLRGVSNPTKDNPKVLPPTTTVGQELPLRVSVKTERGRNPYVIADPVSEPELKHMNDLYQEGAVWGSANGKAMAGVGARDNAPAEDEPPF